MSAQSSLVSNPTVILSEPVVVKNCMTIEVASIGREGTTAAPSFSGIATRA